MSLSSVIPGAAVPGPVLIVDGDPAERQALALALHEAGCEAVVASSEEQARAELARTRFEFLCYRLESEGEGAATSLGTFLGELLQLDEPPLVVVLVAAESASLASRGLAAMRRGADDVVALPCSPGVLLMAFAKAAARRSRQRQTAAGINPREGGRRRLAQASDMVVGGARMEALVATLRKMAEVTATVLFFGEAGTGKELAARLLHQLSPRRDGPFIGLNCCAIPETLLESELFGYRQGAFTGAAHDQAGNLRAGGGRHPVSRRDRGSAARHPGQAAAGAARRGGRAARGERSRRHRRARDGGHGARPRERDRPGPFSSRSLLSLECAFGDAPAAARAPRGDPSAGGTFHRPRAGSARHASLSGISPEAIDLLVAHGWPGNVRELENVIERAVVLAEGTCIDAQSRGIWLP